MNAASWIVLGAVMLAACAAVGVLVHRRRRYGSSACNGCAFKSLCDKK